MYYGRFCFLFPIWYLLKNETENITLFGLTFNPENYKNYVLVSGLSIAYLTGLFEVIYQSNVHIASSNSAIALPILYHLIFSVVLTSVLIKNKTNIGYQLAIVIAILNIILFTFGFSNYAFFEHTEIISSGKGQPIAFYLHYISLGITLYFGYQLFQIKNRINFELFKNRYFIWTVAFFIIYIASSEVMLHGLVLMNSAITPQDVQASGLYPGYKSGMAYSHEYVANEIIKISRIKIIKTGFPVLWGVLAFVFLIIGIKKQIKTLRIIALSLLGLTIVKLFFYDISNISETGKIISFILLGILILIISFVYQKIKVLVIDENKPNENHEIK
ncbi:DUF2339 domain-containing protein [Flavobacterium chryseum]|uniref:DUF2339 domain-containing protein n=1 Tax=Flavobacterium sp. P3160 TaxID=2512113 RepID=UPI0029392E37|nr:DUF2339 domain-containing protein [Flavobacterium sp. P3160]